MNLILLFVILVAVAFVIVLIKNYEARLQDLTDRLHESQSENNKALTQIEELKQQNVEKANIRQAELFQLLAPLKKHQVISQNKLNKQQLLNYANDLNQQVGPFLNNKSTNNTSTLDLIDSFLTDLNEFTKLRNAYVNQVNHLIAEKILDSEPFELVDVDFSHVQNSLIGELTEKRVRQAFQRVIDQQDYLLTSLDVPVNKQRSTQVDMVIINPWGIFLYEIKTSSNALKLSRANQQHTHIVGITHAILGNVERAKTDSKFNTNFFNKLSGRDPHTGKIKPGAGEIKPRYIVLGDNSYDGELVNGIPTYSLDNAIAEFKQFKQTQAQSLDEFKTTKYREHLTKYADSKYERDYSYSLPTSGIKDLVRCMQVFLKMR